MSVLERIVETTRHDLDRRRREVPLAELERRLSAPREDRPFSEAVARPGIGVIAEHKRRSPSAGDIRAGASVTGIVGAYERGGAAALSILTESANFAVAGADALLLIVAALHPVDLRRLHEEALALDLDVLVEVHDERELEAALEVDADVIGINNRDLADFSVDVERTFELLSDVPAGKAVVSESGYSSRAQLDDLDRVGVDAVLIGESLMRAPDVESACRELTGQGEGVEPGSTAL